MANPVSSNIPQRFQSAFQEASRTTGVQFDYLLHTAKRESALNPNAKAPTSSATGLFQFIEQTWLETMKEAGPSLGFKNAASHISEQGGKYKVSDPQIRQQILDMRKDPDTSALLAGAYARKNEAMLAQRLDRKPSAGELYAAHFLGAQGSGRLIELAESNPNVAAYKIFPQQAQANKPIFFDKQGNARSVADVYSNLVGTVPEKKSTFARIFNLGEWFKPKASMKASRFEAKDAELKLQEAAQARRAELQAAKQPEAAQVLPSDTSLQAFFDNPVRKDADTRPSRFSLGYSPEQAQLRSSRLISGGSDSAVVGGVKGGGERSRIFTEAIKSLEQEVGSVDDGMPLPKRKPVTADVYVDGLLGALPKPKPTMVEQAPLVLDPTNASAKRAHGALDLSAFLDRSAFGAPKKS